MAEKIVIFGGYSNSGKTTHLTPVLEELGYTVLSSSVLIHSCTEKIVKTVLGIRNYDSFDRQLLLSTNSVVIDSTNSYGQNEYGIKNLSSRDLCIEVAEKVLVPVFSRSVFINSIADRIIAQRYSLRLVRNGDTSSNTKYAVEVFNAEECKLLQDRLQASNINDFICLNLRRDEEDSSVDKRTLIPNAIAVYNNGNYFDLKYRMSMLLNTNF